MLVFVDESGDAGMTGKAGQTPYLVVTLVLFEDHDQAEKADHRIDLVRTELALGGKFEFKFHACGQDVRRHFLDALQPYTWFYLGIVINKAKLYSPTFSSPMAFYNYTTSLVFENVSRSSIRPSS